MTSNRNHQLHPSIQSVLLQHTGCLLERVTRPMLMEMNRRIRVLKTRLTHPNKNNSKPNKQRMKLQQQLRRKLQKQAHKNQNKSNNKRRERVSRMRRMKEQRMRIRRVLVKRNKTVLQKRKVLSLRQKMLRVNSWSKINLRRKWRRFRHRINK